MSGEKERNERYQAMISEEWCQERRKDGQLSLRRNRREKKQRQNRCLVTPDSALEIPPEVLDILRGMVDQYAEVPKQLNAIGQALLMPHITHEAIITLLKYFDQLMSNRRVIGIADLQCTQICSYMAAKAGMSEKIDLKILRAFLGVSVQSDYILQYLEKGDMIQCIREMTQKIVSVKQMNLIVGTARNLLSKCTDDCVKNLCIELLGLPLQILGTDERSNQVRRRFLALIEKLAQTHVLPSFDNAVWLCLGFIQNSEDQGVQSKALVAISCLANSPANVAVVMKPEVLSIVEQAMTRDNTTIYIAAFRVLAAIVQHGSSAEVDFLARNYNLWVHIATGVRGSTQDLRQLAFRTYGNAVLSIQSIPDYNFTHQVWFGVRDSGTLPRMQAAFALTACAAVDQSFLPSTLTPEHCIQITTALSLNEPGLQLRLCTLACQINKHCSGPQREWLDSTGIIHEIEQISTRLHVEPRLNDASCMFLRNLRNGETAAAY